MELLTTSLSFNQSSSWSWIFRVCMSEITWTFTCPFSGDSLVVPVVALVAFDVQEVPF